MVPSTNYELFFEEISRAKNIAAITGAGLSDASFISSFRDSRLYWRRYKATNLMSPEAFKQCPGLVWEFHHYRREAAFNALPNKAHLALARYADSCTCADEDDDDENGKRRFTVITQNVDGLHQAAGSEDVIELLGNVKKTICTNCQDVEVNMDRPICEALRGREFVPMKGRVSSKIPIKSLPKCRFCEQLLRPHVTWFGEDFDKAVFDRTRDLLEECDFCLLIGVSPVGYPASTVASLLAQNGIPVAEFNTTEGPSDQAFTYFFPGPYESTVPLALKMTHCSCN